MPPTDGVDQGSPAMRRRCLPASSFSIQGNYLAAWVSLTAPGPEPGGQRHPDQVGKAVRLHLLHQVGAVDLDGPGADVELMGDDLVRPPDEEAFQYIELPRRQRGYPGS